METTINNEGMETNITLLTTKVCKVCGETLPLSEFQRAKAGGVFHTCKKCVNENKQATKYAKIELQRKQEAMHDAMFEGKQPMEVLQMMGRAKKWLEARGYEIVLRGSLMVKKEVKFE